MTQLSLVQEGRKNYLDNLRWLTIILVVLFHIFFYYNNIGVEAMFLGAKPYEGTGVTFAGLFQYFVYPWFMLLLFVVSGIGASYSLKKKSNKAFIKDRARRVLVPSTLGILAFGWIGGYIIYRATVLPKLPPETPSFIRAIIVLSSGTGALWFCQVLFIDALILILVRSLITKLHKSDQSISEWFTKQAGSPIFFAIMLVLIYLLLWGASHLLNMPVINSYRFGIYIMAYLMGYYVFSSDKVIEQLKHFLIPILCVAIVSGCWSIYKSYGTYYAEPQLLATWYTNLYAFAMVLLLLGGGAVFFNHTNQFTAFMRRTSFGIYVFHIPVLLAVNYFLSHMQLQLIFIYIIEFVCAIGFSLLLNVVISRIPVLRYMILGIKK